MRHAQHEPHGDRSVHRISAGLENLRANLARVRLAAHHHGVARAIRLRSPGQAGGHQTEESTAHQAFARILTQVWTCGAPRKYQTMLGLSSCHTSQTPSLPISRFL